MQLALALERLIFERCLQSRLWEIKKCAPAGNRTRFCHLEHDRADR
jgi:hypothetical protein